MYCQFAHAEALVATRSAPQSDSAFFILSYLRRTPDRPLQLLVMRLAQHCSCDVQVTRFALETRHHESSHESTDDGNCHFSECFGEVAHDARYNRPNG